MEDFKREPIAIIGIGCRFPQAHNLQEFWQLLRSGKDAIQEVPADRWDIQRLYDPDRTVPGKMASRWGGFLDQIDQFDWQSFGIDPREATSMDPQHRLLLEVAWEALEDAGLPFAEVAGSQTSVSVGMCWNDYMRLQTRNWSQIDKYTTAGSYNGAAANRLSYQFDLRGWSASVDSLCSSSLTAVHLACQSLWAGEASLALAGGVSLMVSPDGTIILSQTGLLSGDGHCKTLDAAADGYVRGEGAGVVVLKQLSQVKESDRVYALLRGVAVNHGGYSQRITASNQTAQEALLRDAYHKAGISPSDVDYIELHGSGFPRGDVVETNALGSVLGAEPERTHPCLIGSVKTNIGHLEGASGIASLIKVALSLYHREIPPTLNLQSVNQDIHLADLHLAVPQTCIPWPEKGGALQVAGVTALGFTGTNAHAVLTAYQSQVSEGECGHDQDIYRLLPLSAKSEQVLYELAQAYRDFLLTTEAGSVAPSSWRDICYSVSVRRTHHRYRLAVGGHTPQEAAEELSRYLQGTRGDGGQGQAAVPTRLATIKALYTEGAEVDWAELYEGKDCRCVSLPTYAWQRERLWPEWLDVEEISTPPEVHAADSRKLRNPGKIEVDGRSLEEVLTELWTEVLGAQEVNTSTSFFECGGHSLLAVKLLVRIQSICQVKLLLKDLLEAPTPSACAEIVRQKKASQANPESMLSSLPQIVPDPWQRYQPFPLTDIQQAYWVGRSVAFDMGNVGNHGYIEVEATDLDLQRFNQALQRLIERHDMLRAVLLPGGQQMVLERVPPFEIKIVDLRGKTREEQASQLEQMRQTLDHQILPVERWPAFELWISRLDEQQVRLHLSVEFIFVDAWSINTLIHEFIRLYYEPDLSLPPPALTFRDYVQAEASLHSNALYQRSREYWHSRLSSLPPAPDLPLVRGDAGHDLSEKTLHQPHFVHREARLERRYWQQLKALAANIGVTPSGVLLTAFAEVIACWSKSARFSLNLSTFNRLPLHPSVNEIVGDFTSLLVLAVDHTTPASFEKRAKRLQEQLWKDLEHFFYSGIAVLRELLKMEGEVIKAVMPIVFTSLLIQDMASPLSPPWGKTLYCVTQTPQVWLDHQVLEVEGELVIHWQSVDAIFPAGLIDDMFGAYCQLLRRLADPTHWSEEVRVLLLEHENKHFIASVIPTEISSGANGTQQTGETQESEDWEELGEELVKNSQAQMQALLEVKIDETFLDVWETLLDIHMSVVCNVLKDFNVFQSHNDQYSLNELMSKCAIHSRYKKWVRRNIHLLVEKGYLHEQDGLFQLEKPLPTAELDELWGVYQKAAARLTDPMLLASDWHKTNPLMPSRTIKNLKSLLTEELHSAEIYLSTEVRETERLFDVSNTRLQMLMQELVRLSSGRKKIRVLEIGAGFGAATAYILPALPRSRTEYIYTDISLYFIQEAQKQFAAYPFIKYRLLDIEKDPQSQGYEMHNFDIIIAANVLHTTANIAETLTHVRSLLKPSGLLLLVEGTHFHSLFDLTMGLQGIDHFEDTDLRPSQPLLSREQWRKLLKEQEFALLAIFNKAGTLSDFLGIDVLLTQGPASVSPLRLTGLYEHMRSELPEYMTPARIVPLEALPLTSNGEVDRNTLPNPLIQQHEHASKSTAARTPTEQALVDLWCDLLGLSHVGIKENFLRLGGDSLLATKLLARVRADFHVEVPFRTLFKNPTIAALAATIEQLVTAQQMGQPSSEGVQVGKEPCVVPLVPALSSDEEEGVL